MLRGFLEKRYVAAVQHVEATAYEYLVSHIGYLRFSSTIAPGERRMITSQ